MRTRLIRLWSTGVRGPAPGIWSLLAVACLAPVLGLHAAGGRDAASDVVRLESIAGQLDDQTAAVLLQTSEPVPYVTSDPDPFTVCVDLRNATGSGVKNRFTKGAGGLVSSVSVEDSKAFDGVPVARVRVSLAGPFAHRVRSARNVIRVEVDRQPVEATPARAALDASQPDVAAPPTNETRATRGRVSRQPATRLQSLRAMNGPHGPIVVLEGNGALVPAGVELTKESPYRLVLDFPGISSSAVKPTTAVGKAPVNQVRVALHSAQPLITRVVLDLTQPAPYRLDQTESDGLSIVFGEPQEGAAEAPAVTPAVASVSPAAKRPAEVKRATKVRESGPPAAPPGALPAAVTAAAPPPPPPVATPANETRVAAVPVNQSPPAATQQPPPPAPPPALPVQLTAQSQVGGQKQYSGAPISLDFAGADIRSVLRVFSETSGLNIIIDPKVQGTVDVALRDVPWDQALEIILKTAGLGYTIEGNVVRIAPVGVLADEEAQRRKLADEQALGGSLETLTRTLSYATADDLRPVLEKSALTKRGQVQVDKRTNTLIVRDLPAALATTAQILDQLDRPQPQVEIEARIVQTTRNFARQLGVQWGFNARVDQAVGNTTPLAFPNNGSLSGRTGGVQGPDNTPSAVNLKTPGQATSAVGLALGSVNGAFGLDLALSALESSGQGRILSTPRVIAQNNFAATMMQGVEIPIQTIANNTVTVTFKPAALTLQVTPQITAAGTVILNVQVENASPDYTKQINNIPPINTQRANTQVLVKDNDTIVIGGVYVSQEQMQNDHTPGLYKIPLLGWLFKRDIIDDQANELLIFITPRIIKQG